MNLSPFHLIQECGKCNKQFDMNYENFYRNKNRKYGYDSLCKSCRKAYNAHLRKERDKKGLCRNCKNKKSEKSNTCLVCWSKSTSERILKDRNRWQEIYDMLYGKEIYCPYTGTQLFAGYNLVFDHILPKSKFPRLRFNISNLEPIRKDINMCKSTFSKEKFIDICKEIVSFLYP